ncbi:hypothetical protein SPRG_00399 [Saprolegnia parasitica CBS 223.65]|uniref:Uncharacterized protein n=1 Tax=Saprolegnia parasitica (strain CBS 223.65) TaxID=695850 RepID=A0A067CXX1_SAPPC|nr:hypothetical protein SPRG_00399 [Saprolegnia parasitica CBS 223.65]KDO35554.1 hypothetical protein SPRG_00399 [Saprolegnia parasitica CBS 223.65]|eukprot:XP_012193888.1 hypothetical protein SPRG_00399 [Saprolegnia parasitica CBS 223.65]
MAGTRQPSNFASDNRGNGQIDVPSCPAHDAKTKASDKASELKDKASDKAHELKDKASDMSSKVADKARNAKDKATGSMKTSDNSDDPY